MLPAPDIKSTYGLLCKTILRVLGKDDISIEKASVFGLYMHWGVLIAYPGTLVEKKELTARLLQQLSEQHAEVKMPAFKQELKMLIATKKQMLTEIYKLVNAAPVISRLDWYQLWADHCKTILASDASYENVVYLLFILQDAMAITPTKVFTALYLVNETLCQHCSVPA